MSVSLYKLLKNRLVICFSVDVYEKQWDIDETGCKRRKISPFVQPKPPKAGRTELGNPSLRPSVMGAAQARWERRDRREPSRSAGFIPVYRLPLYKYAGASGDVYENKGPKIATGGNWKLEARWPLRRPCRRKGQPQGLPLRPGAHRAPSIGSGGCLRFLGARLGKAQAKEFFLTIKA